jgi:DNA invertase Pin-like site-specific DNA recombinase
LPIFSQHRLGICTGLNGNANLSTVIILDLTHWKPSRNKQFTNRNRVKTHAKSTVDIMSRFSAIYIRVSSRDQSHASQLPDLERWVAAHDGMVQWYKDTFTGRTMDRPGMQDLMTDLNAGKLERIVVWRLDRLGRTTRGLCQLFDELGERKVDLVSLRDGFSLSSPAGRLHARILASVAEYEGEIRSERVAAGQAVARRKGKTWGGSTKGWRWKVTDDQLLAIREMHSAKKPVAQISRIVGLSRPTIYRVLEG